NSAILNVAPPANTPAGEINEAHEAGARVRLLITDIETDLAGITGRMVDEQTLTPDSRSAILVNAIDPQDEDVLDRDSADNSRMASTAPFCFRSFNIYTIEAHGIVNAPDGSELARYTVREVAQVAPASELQIRIETQEDFQRSLASGRSHHVATWPNACQVSDIPPQNTEDSDNLALRGRLGPAPAEYSPAQTPTFMARFNGPLMRNTLRAEIAAAGLADPHAFTDSAFPRTVKAEPGDDGDIEPEGIHIGARGSDPETKRVLAYPARLDIEVDGATTTLSNIPHDRDYVDPFVLEMWVKFDSDFDYAEDHFLFDLAEATYTNRVALYYDSTDTAEKRGDLVLHVCDATEAPPLPAQVRFPVTSDTFEPERWYHVAVVVKGLGYNQMALFIDGKSRGHYEPSGALEGNVTADALSIDCGELAWYNDSKIFAPFTWPAENTVVINGELVEHSNATARNLAVRADGRGARGTQARAHYAGARVELYGYDERVVQSRDHVGHPMTIMSRDADSPMLDGALPADMPHDIEVDDGDEDNPDGATAPTTTTADESTDYFDPDPDTDPLTAAYQAATDVNADYAIPPATGSPSPSARSGSKKPKATRSRSPWPTTRPGSTKSWAPPPTLRPASSACSRGPRSGPPSRRPSSTDRRRADSASSV
ncbi:hypothetical protein HQ560_01535, partial [bacterium]|nr:hypothetical protein [bacterium]